MNIEEIQRRSRDIFRQEAADLLSELEAALLELEAAPNDEPALHRVFRVMHTLKGSGATSGFKDLSDFLHHVEDVYNAAREHRLVVTPEIIDLTLGIADTVRAYLEVEGTAATAILHDAAPGLGRLLTFLSPASSTQLCSTPAQPIVRHLRFTPHPQLYLTGNDPGTFLDDLRALAPCDIHLISKELPPLDSLDPEACHLGWDIHFHAPADKAAVADVFMFIAEECTLEFDPPAATCDEEKIVDNTGTPTSGKGTPAASTVHTSPLNDTLRVSADRLDRLVNLIGELVILRSVLGAACLRYPDLPRQVQDASETLQTLTTQLRDEVLNIRMTSIGQTFAKFQRLTRDLSRDLGKDIELVLEGASTEMDKSVLDHLADPLVHLVRNSLDHGLETPAERIAAGKPPRGRLRLAAEQKGDRVLITVGDDGRGLNHTRIRTKAIERGLIPADSNLNENEIYQLVFLPGFSTADKVSELSGRGVGLDVVRRHIEQLRGRIDLRSQPGKGAEFRLSLPLTLAIIEGFMVGVGHDRYVLPLGSARETIDLPTGHETGSGRRNIVCLRDQFIPYLRIRDLFGHGPAPAGVRERIVIVDADDTRIGLVVDEVLGNHQTVIKSLGWLAPKVNIFSGATVLGDGTIALILDIPGLVARTQKI